MPSIFLSISDLRVNQQIKDTQACWVLHFHSTMSPFKFTPLIAVLAASFAFEYPRSNSELSDIENFHFHTSRLAEDIARAYYVGPHKGCIVLVMHPGCLEDFHVSGAAIFRVSSEDFCEDDGAADRMVTVFDEMCYNFIVQTPRVDCFFNVWLAAQWKTIQRSHPEILFLPTSPDGGKIADEVFNLKESDYSSSILAVDFTEDDEDWPFVIYTGNFYERVELPSRNPKILLDQWNPSRTFRLNANLMPDFIENLHNKTLKIMTFDYDPYTHYDPLDGTEIKLIQEFCKRHNCSLVAVDDGHYWGDIFENGTSDGLAGMVYDGRADFGAAAVYLWLPYFYFVDYSTSYLYSASTLLVPKPNLVSAWKTPFMPFDIWTWTAYVCSIVMAAVFMYIITYLTIKFTRFADAVRKRHMFLDKLDCVFRALGLGVLQQPSTPLVPHTPIRHLFTSFEFLFLVTSTIYSAELASYLTVPRYTKPIDTLIELANSGMIWIGEHESWTYSLRDMTDPEIITIVENYRVYNHEQLNKLAPTGDYGLIVERLPGGHYTEQEHVTYEVVTQSHMMAENLFGSPPVIAVRKGSPYRKRFNKIISEVLRGGLYLYWEGEMSRKYLNSRKQLALKEAERPHYKDEPRRLEISHIRGALYMYAIGIAISTLALVAEIAVHRINKPRITRIQKTHKM